MIRRASPDWRGSSSRCGPGQLQTAWRMRSALPLPHQETHSRETRWPAKDPHARTLPPDDEAVAVVFYLVNSTWPARVSEIVRRSDRPFADNRVVNQFVIITGVALGDKACGPGA